MVTTEERSLLPRYQPDDYQSRMSSLDPIDMQDGYLVKRGDAFTLGMLSGSKVRQCLHVVQSAYETIVTQHHGGLLTAAGLPSPQTAIVAGVAQYFGLASAIVVPRYENTKRDVQRLNTSLAQRWGARVYGSRNPRPSGVSAAATRVAEVLGYYRVAFGMTGTVAMAPVVAQVANVPDTVREIVVISGSGLTALSILQGLARYQKTSVRTVTVVALSDHFQTHKRRWYDSQPEQFGGTLTVVPSPASYQRLVTTTPFDWTYEAKAWQWLQQHRAPDPSILFWVVGSRVYDVSYVEPIDWHEIPTAPALW